MKLKYKYKLIILAGLFFAVSSAMIFYGFGILNAKNMALGSILEERQTEFEVLEFEQKSFEQGKKDLATVNAKALPPMNLFSQDTKVVKQIKAIEDMAARNNLKLTLSISGTSAAAVKAKSASGEIFVIPYTASVQGTYASLSRYLQELERLQFATHPKTLAIDAKEDGEVTAQMASEFYIQK